MQEYIITSIKEVLRVHFSRAVELKVGSPDAGAQVKAGGSGHKTLYSLPRVNACSSFGSLLKCHWVREALPDLRLGWG